MSLILHKEQGGSSGIVCGTYGLSSRLSELTLKSNFTFRNYLQKAITVPVKQWLINFVNKFEIGRDLISALKFCEWGILVVAVMLCLY